MSFSTNTRGVGTRARAARCTIHYDSIDNQPVVRIGLPDGRKFCTDPENWRDYLRLGFSPNVSLDDSGNGHSYPRTMAHSPDEKAARSGTQTLARIFVALRMVREAKAGGEPVNPKGWVVRHANGDTLDLRDVNLVKVPASGHRNSYRTFWGVWKRWCLVEQGKNPNAEFAKRRRAFKAKGGPKYLGAARTPPTNVRSQQIVPPMLPLNSSTVGSANDD
jgi:hypothetical protein